MASSDSLSETSARSLSPTALRHRARLQRHTRTMAYYHFRLHELEPRISDRMWERLVVRLRRV